MLPEGVIIALIGLIGGVIGTAITNRNMGKKINADAYKSASEGFAASSAALLERIESLETENKQLKEIIASQTKYIRELEQRINRAGLAMK